MKCRDIKAEWAAQRIHGLTYLTLARGILGMDRNSTKADAVKTLIREFHYPRRGPGMMWSKMAELVEQSGSRVVYNAPVERIFWERGRITGVQAGGQRYSGRHFINSLPLRNLIRMLDPDAPPS